MTMIDADAPAIATTKPRRRRLGLAGIVIASALLLAACMNGDQQRSFDLVNYARAYGAMPALADDETARNKAQAWAEHLASNNTLKHSTLASGMGSGWSRLGENVGYGSSVDGVQQQFLQSYGHRANILDRRFTHIGVGVAKGHGRTFVVQVFVQR